MVWSARTDDGARTRTLWRGEDARSNGARACTVRDAQPAAHARVGSKWRRSMCTGKSSTIYRSSVGQERNDRLMTGHTSVDSRGVQWKNLRINLFLFGDSGFSEEDEE